MSRMQTARALFNVKWQTFSVIALVVAGLLMAFFWVMSEWSEKRFEQGRSLVSQHYEQQLNALIAQSADKMIQLSSAVSLNRDLMGALLEGDRLQVDIEMERVDWNLQVDAGLEVFALFDLQQASVYDPNLLYDYPEVREVLAKEMPAWRTDCGAVCKVISFTPLMFRGEVAGVLALAEPLSNVMLRFQHVANIDTVLLGRKLAHDSSRLQESVHRLADWQVDILALTRPDQSLEIIQAASKEYSLIELQASPRLIPYLGQIYEVSAIQISDQHMVLVSDVTSAMSMVQQSRNEAMQISILALVLGELALLYLLRRPLNRIKANESLLPLLAEQQFNELRRWVSQSAPSIFKGQGEVIKRSALALTDKIEGLQYRVQRQSDLLAEHIEALALTRNLSDTLVDSVDSVVMILDENGCVRAANECFYRYTGRAQSKVLGESFECLLQPDAQNRRIQQRLLEVIGGQLTEFEHQGGVCDSDHQVYPMVWRHIPVYLEVDDVGGEGARPDAWYPGVRPVPDDLLGRSDDSQQDNKDLLVPQHKSRRRQLISIGSPVHTAVTERESAWLLQHDVETGFLNQQGFAVQFELLVKQHRCSQISESFSLIRFPDEVCVYGARQAEGSASLYRRLASLVTQKLKSNCSFVRLPESEMLIIHHGLGGDAAARSVAGLLPELEQLILSFGLVEAPRISCTHGQLEADDACPQILLSRLRRNQE